MSVQVTIDTRDKRSTTMATRGRAFRGRKRAALVNLRNALQRVLTLDVKAAVGAEARNDNPFYVFPTVGLTRKANDVLAAVTTALST